MEAASAFPTPVPGARARSQTPIHRVTRPPATTSVAHCLSGKGPVRPFARDLVRSNALLARLARMLSLEPGSLPAWPGNGRNNAP